MPPLFTPLRSWVSNAVLRAEVYTGSTYASTVCGRSISRVGNVSPNSGRDIVGILGIFCSPTVRSVGKVIAGASGILSGNAIDKALGFTKSSNNGAVGKLITGILNCSCGASCIDLSAILAVKVPGAEPIADIIPDIIGSVGPIPLIVGTFILILGATKSINAGTSLATSESWLIASKALLIADSPLASALLIWLLILDRVASIPAATLIMLTSFY